MKKRASGVDENIQGTYLYISRSLFFKNKKNAFSERVRSNLVDFLHLVGVHFDEPGHLELLAVVQVHQILAFFDAPLRTNITTAAAINLLKAAL
jgi:hypothetical protein